MKTLLTFFKNDFISTHFDYLSKIHQHQSCEKIRLDLDQNFEYVLWMLELHKMIFRLESMIIDYLFASNMIVFLRKNIQSTYFKYLTSTRTSSNFFDTISMNFLATSCALITLKKYSTTIWKVGALFLLMKLIWFQTINNEHMNHNVHWFHRMFSFGNDDHRRKVLGSNIDH